MPFDAFRGIMGTEESESGGRLLLKEFVFYSVAAGVIGLIAQLAGASLPVILFSSLLVPPVFLLIVRILR